MRQKWPKLAAFIDDSETDVLSHLDIPEQHRDKLHSTVWPTRLHCKALAARDRILTKPLHLTGMMRTVRELLDFDLCHQPG